MKINKYSIEKINSNIVRGKNGLNIIGMQEIQYMFNYILPLAKNIFFVNVLSYTFPQTI